MKRLLALVLSAAAIAGSLPGEATATDQHPRMDTVRVNVNREDANERTGRWRGPCSTWEYGENLTSPAIFNADLERSHRMMVRLIVCVFDRWAPGNAATALYVAHREAGVHLLPWAYNATSGCMGLFQHSEWAGRRWLLWPGWFRKPIGKVSWSDPRANAIMAARMVAGVGAWDEGWGPWGG